MRLECVRPESGEGLVASADRPSPAASEDLMTKYEQLMSTSTMTRGRCPVRDTQERRQRNRSLTSLLCTPPPYPGYGAMLASSMHSPNSNSDTSTQSSISPTIPIDRPDRMPFVPLSTSLYSTRPKFSCNTPPLCSPEDDLEFTVIEIDDAELIKKYSKASSGYGGSISSSSSSDDREQIISPDPPLQSVAESEPSDHVSDYGITGRCSRITMRCHKSVQERRLEANRRRSVPASLRDAFTAEMMRVLQLDGNVGPMETDVDSGMSAPYVDAHRVNRPESVLELARKFAEISAQQEVLLRRSKNAINKEAASASKIGPNGSITVLPRGPYREPRRLGGIAALSDKHNMGSRPNFFRQMDKINTANNDKPAPSVVIRNPNSIKEALLRWCQAKVQGYPVSITNFSSSWADGMAFCALIHHFAPHSFDFAALNPRNRKDNFELAFRVAEENGICPLLEVEDMLMMGDRPDWKCVFTYVQSFYKQFRDRP